MKQNLTLIIVAVAFAMSAFLGTVDYIFQTTVSGIIANDTIAYIAFVILFFAGAAGFYFNNQQE